MCYFVTVGVREAGVLILDAEKRRRDRRFGVSPVKNPHVTAIFPPADKLFWITHGGCSCDLYLARKRGDPEEATVEKERTRYRNKGWSEAKISRALKAKHATRTPVPRGQREDTPTEKLSDLLSRLAGVAGGVRIFAHEYSGAVDEEVVTGQQGKPLSVRCIAEGRLSEDLVVDLIEGAD